MIRRRLAPYGGLRVRPGFSWPAPAGEGRAQMSAEWEMIESGPADADRTVLLIPGGLNAARSYAELMAQPALSGVRLVAVTLPGHAGGATVRRGGTGLGGARRKGRWRAHRRGAAHA